MASTSFIDPSSLSFASQPFVPASPAPSSSYTHDDDDHDDMDPTHSSGPARKRARTAGKDTSSTLSVSEQRKEARAHRNRIAAQNSRDRRKAQFSYLERRVSELEEENRRLKAGMAVTHPIVTAAPISAQPVFAANTVFTPILPGAVEDHLRAEREKERERENEELKERIKTLERGWDAVVKALAAQGVAAGLLGATQTPTSTPAPITTTTTQSSPSKLEAPAKPTFIAFPSPAPSHSSLDFESSSPTPDFFPLTSTSPSPASQPSPQAQPSHSDSTRHLARVATTGGPSLVRSVSLQRVVSDVLQGAAAEGATAGDEDDNDKVMEALFREILASPRASHAAVPSKGAAAGVAQVTAAGVEGGVVVVGGGAEQEEKGKGAKAEEHADADEGAVAEWANEIEMQRMLDSMIMDIQGANELGVLDMGAGMGMDMNMSMGLDMDLGMAFDAGVDYSRAAWDISGAGVF
ncbi:hypothetical protein CVT25_007252 [Psilocybe cyanescens]|uniref:X-box-binding protein 1 n=1 Tax=Psilocybe cyanescens TaxID=93625 RepID=A0A409WV93_PSICY|nr:hypothetical protein CVT25_007252 [Psilocybe cyanescens]